MAAFMARSSSASTGRSGSKLKRPVIPHIAEPSWSRTPARVQAECLARGRERPAILALATLHACTIGRRGALSVAVLRADRGARSGTLVRAADEIRRDSSANRRGPRALGIVAAAAGAGVGDDADEGGRRLAVLDAEAGSTQSAARSEGWTRGERRARARGRGRARSGCRGGAGRGLAIDVALTVAARRAATLVWVPRVVLLRGASAHERGTACISASATADGERQRVALAAVLAIREAPADHPDDAPRLTRTPIGHGG
jgi:hypothetical protein